MIRLLAKYFARWFFKSHEESIDVAGQIIAVGEAKNEPVTHIAYW